jgi:hypothetical protein
MTCQKAIARCATSSTTAIPPPRLALLCTCGAVTSSKPIVLTKYLGFAGLLAFEPHLGRHNDV